MTARNTERHAPGRDAIDAPGRRGEPDLLDRLLARPTPPDFALLHRPETSTPGAVDILLGDVSHPTSLARLPLPDLVGPQDATTHDALILVPYRQLAERGLAAPDDGAPLIALTVTEQAVLPMPEVLSRLPDTPVALSGHHFDLSDEEYADVVRHVVADEIGSGEGANFVIKRTLLADLGGESAHTALAVFRRLIALEPSAYWTSVVCCDRLRGGVYREWGSALSWRMS